MNRLINEWRRSRTITITVYCPVCELPNDYTFNLPTDIIDHILHLGFTEGVRHWVEHTEILEDECFGECDCEQVSRGGGVVLYDRNGKDSYVLDLENFLSGFYIFFARHLAMSMFVDGKVSFPKLSPKSCDEIIQYALFDEIRYPNEESNVGDDYVN